MLPFSDFLGFLSLAVVLLVSLPLHEMAHAYTADYFGDDTPRMYGRLTANPLAHLDLFGSLMLLLAGFGWAKPVPVSEYALERRSRSAPMLVALAGPMANLGLAILGAVIFRIGVVNTQSVFARFLWIFIFFNLILFLFNMIPLFPLDGEKVLIYLLPADGQYFMERLRRYSFGPLLVVVLVLPMLGLPVVNWLIFNPASWLARLLI